MAWTDEMIDKLKHLWKKGITTNDIAKELGLSKNSVVGKVHRLNLDARPSPIKKKEDENTLSDQQNEKILASNFILKQVDREFNDLTIKSDDNQNKNTCIKLSELDSHTCRWPIGDPKDDNFCFCGKKVKAGQTYCDEHAAIAYVKPIKK